MKLEGQQVTHKAFGTGTIIENNNGKLVILFQVGEKKFQFPDAFGTFLQASDQDFCTYVESAKNEKEQIKAEEKEQQLKKTVVSIANKSRARANRQNKDTKVNIAFKCNYCDGGRSEAQVGFHGVCSDSIIENNIVKEGRTWCSSEECACKDYLDGIITREELDSMCEEEGFVCYESQMLRDWKALAGIVQHGDRKGEPMKLNQVQSNSLCVLTTRYPENSESERFIFAVFLIDDTYEGDSREEGYVSTNSEYKLKLSPEESQKMLFWNYHCNDNNPESPVWNSGLHRYFADETAAYILRDICELKKGTVDQALAEDFYEYFCKINHITELDAPNGALKR